MDATDRARYERMAKRLRAGAGVLEELALEVEAMLGEKATPGQDAKRALDWFCGAWQGRYATKYVVNGAKDMAMLKRVLKSMSVDELELRMKRFFESSDPFYVNAKHGLGVFVAAVNKFGASDGREEEDLKLVAPVADCRHKPACKSDQEHTRRKMAEMRDSAR